MKDCSGAFITAEVTAEPTGSGALDGLAFAAKDVFGVRGHTNSAGNPDWLRTHEPASRHADAVSRLLAAGARLTGMTHTDELMYSLNGENMHFGTPRNPRAPGRIPGGSSSGSASATAEGAVDFALGTDTGGSVRVPASYCGLFGFRPTHGAVSEQGVIPLAPSFDTVGWFARDARLLLAVGEILLPGTAANQPSLTDGTDLPDLPSRTNQSNRPDLPHQSNRPDLPHQSNQPGQPHQAPAPHSGGAAFGFRRFMLLEEAWALVEDEGTSGALLAEVNRQFAGPRLPAVSAADGNLAGWMNEFRLLQGLEIWQLHGAWVLEEQPTFAPDIAGRLKGARESDPQAAGPAAIARLEKRDRMRELLGEDGLLILPTTPGPAPRLGEQPEALDRYRYRLLQLTCVAGLAGLPQVTVPLQGEDGLPIGLSFIAPHGKDRELLRWVADRWGEEPIWPSPQVEPQANEDTQKYAI